MMANMIKLKLRRIYLVVNISKVVKYKKLIKRQKIEELKLVKVNRVEEWEVEKILNKRLVQEYVKYLVGKNSQQSITLGKKK